MSREFFDFEDPHRAIVSYSSLRLLHTVVSLRQVVVQPGKTTV